MIAVPNPIRTWAEIDLEAIRHNVRVVRERIGPDAAILAVVKADAYGHGVGQVVRALTDEVEIFGVANLEEARGVASAGTGRDIMILSPSLPAERRAAVDEGFLVTVSSASEAAEFAGCGPVRINFKIDTGMGRVGCAADSAPAELREILALANVQIHSVSTHLPSADEDVEFTKNQLAGFAELMERVREIVPGVRTHSLNSAGILTRASDAGGIVRPGLMLYGCSPIPSMQKNLRPALVWKTRVSQIRSVPAGCGIGYGRTFITPGPMRVAVLAAGYADGYPRQVSGRNAAVLIHGNRCALLGRVTMDQIVVDVSEVPDVQVGDTAVLLGEGGCEDIPVGELAQLAGTIPWDIFTGIGQRVRRFHSGVNC
jgi:alanine racemase